MPVLSSSTPPTSTPPRLYRPSHLLRWMAHAMAWIWWLIVLAALFLALTWGALHLLIVPRIGEFRPSIEKRLSHVMGVPVRIGGITAESHTLIPSFELQGVRLLDSAGRDALVLKKVTALLSPRSLMQLRFEQLVIDQPELDVRRNAQGKILVAGLDMQANATDDGSNASADWFFSQREFAIRSGTVRWTDELRGAPTLALNQVDLVLRNPGRRHLFRLDATPAVGWGERFSVVGQTRSPLISLHPGRWREWDGDLYAHFTRVDASQLKRYADLGVDLIRGVGALRAWATLQEGRITDATADVVLSQVDLRLAKNLPPIALQSVSGRFTGQALSGGLRVSTEGLSIRSKDGLQWPGGNMTFMQTAPANPAQAVGEFKADRIDMAALAQIADRLPLPTATHSLINSLAPKGLITTIKTAWQGQLDEPSKYEAQGRVQGFSVAAKSANTALPGMPKDDQNRPGVRGATVDFKLNQSGGEAKLSIANGALELPGAFEDPVILLDQLSTDAKWTLSGDKLDLQLNNIKFANADTEGQAQAHWQTADPAKSNAKSRFPGVLDLQGSLSRGEGTKVHRYLPVSISESARTYVRNAVVQGRITAGQFKIKGDLFDMPFANPQQGEFRIAAQVADAHFAYVPKQAQTDGSLPWPPITQINGELVLDRTSLNVKASSARVGSNNSLEVLRADALIPNLAITPTVIIRADVRGSARDVLGTVNTSPLLEITNKNLTQLTATGNADVSLQLNLPLFNLEQSKVQGSVTLTDSDVLVRPDSPLLARSKGLITFSENGFAVKDATVRMYGGEAKLEGGTQLGAGPDDASMVFRAQGVASAEGLRQAKELGFVSRLGQSASGSAAYVATLGFRRGVSELVISSNLQGMALSFPAPLGKPAETALPLRYENSLLRDSLAAGQKMQDQVLVDIGQLASIAYVRDVSGNEPRVLRGGIGVGLSQGEVAPVADNNVVANINFAQVDLDAWQKVLSSAAGASFSPTPAPPAGRAAAVAAPSGYLPNIIAVRAKTLVLEGHTLQDVVVGGSREGLTWRANLDAQELNGYVEYRQPNGANPGRLYARLARLTIAPTEAKEIEATLSEQPASIPAMDIVVDDFELRGRKFGRIEIEAVNRGAFAQREDAVREWRLNKFNVIMPEAQMTATGNWAAVSGASARAGNGQRRTVMNFRLDIEDSGLLLKRLGMDKVINQGKGKLEGQITWTGSPLALDYPSLGGNFNVNIESGQFLKADPGLAKLLGVLSLQSLPRRLALDFKDVFSEGFSFDFVRGDVRIDQGVAVTNNLQMKGVNAAVLMEGTANIAKETQDLRVVVVPEINAGTVSLIAAIINPAIGLGTFLAQLILRRPLIAATTQEFHVEGTWVDPKVNKVQRKVVAPPQPQY